MPMEAALVHPVINWTAIGIAVTASLTLGGALISLILRGWDRRLTKLESMTEASQYEIAEHKRLCLDLRAKCREEVFSTFAGKTDMCGMHGETKEAIKDLGKMLEARLGETRKDITERIDFQSKEVTEFRREIQAMLRSHRHDDRGRVMFQGD